MNKSTYHVFFSNLANPLRIKIVTVLKEHPKLTVSELSKELKVEQSKLSHALRNLRECNIVNVKIKGKERHYKLNRKTILPILRYIDRHAKQFCTGECNHCKY